MMKKFIILTIIIFWANDIMICQETTISLIRKNGCEKLDPANIGSFREPTLIDYVINHVLTDRKDTIFITNRFNLVSIEPNFYSNDTISFKTKFFNLTASKKSVNLNELGNIQSDTFDINNQKSIAIYSINKKVVYGLSEPKDKVITLSNICITNSEGNHCLPDSVISDIFFPNFHNIAYPIHPLKLYYDSKTKYSYLYIFGQNELSKSPEYDVRSFNTYLAKYIFYEGRFIKRIIVPWRILSAYSWYCDRFIGF